MTRDRASEQLVLGTALAVPAGMRTGDRVLGVLLGTALGDALGLPFEGLPPQRIHRRLARRPLGHSLCCGRGMLSDDTEHAAMVAAALRSSDAEPEQFARALARRLRWWVLALPPGVGLATLRGSVRLWLGFSPARSGVPSAGNGPAMRAALLGLLARDDAHLVALVRASTRITHTDPRAEDGALVVARWARSAGAAIPELLVAVESIEDARFRDFLREAIHAARDRVELEDFRAQLGFDRGVSGFVVHTLPAVAYCWLRHREDPRAAIEAAIRLGGDTDTVAAIVGALLGAELGAEELPRDWLAGIRDWPLGVDHLRGLAEALVQRDAPTPRLPWLGVLGRNVVVMAIVVGHVCLRLIGR